ncbi:hypothetical protein WA158_005568 [Blastocystis sp. Blastoise]
MMQNLSRAIVATQRTLIRSIVTRQLPQDGKNIDDFLKKSPRYIKKTSNSDSVTRDSHGIKKYYIETYGCQMNTEDSDVVRTILNDNGFSEVNSDKEADIVFLNTCSVREHAETKIFNRIGQLRAMSKSMKNDSLLIGILGCMAERLESQLLDSGVNIASGPDCYKDLPTAINHLENRHDSTEYDVHSEETYSDIISAHKSGPPSGFITVMRGCNNMCSYCVVPFTRGRERSKPIDTILREVSYLSSKGYKEITLLGQNVNSYCDLTQKNTETQYVTAPGFSNPGIQSHRNGILFHELLKQVAEVDPEMRIRFTSPHPKDFPLPVLEVIASHSNICKQLHIPAQSGSSSCLHRMNRGYSRESYMQLIHTIKDVLPNVSLSTDIIAGFCGETAEEHKETLSLLQEVQYDTAFMFAYSMREQSSAFKKYKDDVPQGLKQMRLTEIINTFYDVRNTTCTKETDQIQLILLTGTSKHSTKEKMEYIGKNDANKLCIFKDNMIWNNKDIYISSNNHSNIISENYLNLNSTAPEIGRYVAVKVLKSGPKTNIVQPLYYTTLKAFYQA